MAESSTGSTRSNTTIVATFIQLALKEKCLHGVWVPGRYWAALVAKESLFEPFKPISAAKLKTALEKQGCALGRELDRTDDDKKNFKGLHWIDYSVNLVPQRRKSSVKTKRGKKKQLFLCVSLSSEQRLCSEGDLPTNKELYHTSLEINT
jgi:hypothetical protein